MRVLDQPRHDLGVEAGLEDHALLDQLGTQSVSVEQVAVVGDRARAEQRMVKRNRVGILGSAGSRRRVARVAEGDHRTLSELLDRGG